MAIFDQAKARRRALIRSVAALTGDVVVAATLAAAVTWLLNTATLSIFLSFLAWLVAALVWLIASQYVVYPAVGFLFSDSKLEAAAEAMGSLRGVFGAASSAAGRDLWHGLSRQVVNARMKMRGI